MGLANSLSLGNLDATRDWGHAKDYVEAMWSILQLDNPDDFVCATGVSHSVRDLCEYVFGALDLNYLDYVKQDEKFYRPEELRDLKGDATKLRKTIKWKPKYTFETMLDEMIEYFEKVNNRSLLARIYGCFTIKSNYFFGELICCVGEII